MPKSKPSPLFLPIEKVQALFDPFRDNPWVEHKTAIRKHEVRKAIAAGRMQPKPKANQTRRFNIERVAYLAHEGWNDAVEIDVGCPEFGQSSELLTDGWHRLAAAIYRKDKTIRANVSGSLDYARDLFGVDCNQYSKEDSWGA